MRIVWECLCLFAPWGASQRCSQPDRPSGRLLNRPPARLTDRPTARPARNLERGRWESWLGMGPKAGILTRTSGALAAEPAFGLPSPSGRAATHFRPKFRKTPLRTSDRPRNRLWRMPCADRQDAFPFARLPTLQGTCAAAPEPTPTARPPNPGGRVGWPTANLRQSVPTRRRPQPGDDANRPPRLRHRATLPTWPPKSRASPTTLAPTNRRSRQLEQPATPASPGRPPRRTQRILRACWIVPFVEWSPSPLGAAGPAIKSGGAARSIAPNTPHRVDRRGGAVLIPEVVFPPTSDPENQEDVQAERASPHNRNHDIAECPLLPAGGVNLRGPDITMQ